MKDLIERLRNSRDCDELCDEAADAIEKLEAENAALQIRLDVTINNYGYTTRECSDLRTENAALKAELAEVALLKNLLHIARQERDAAQAELAAMREQKPVAYGWLIHDGVYDTICPDEHARHEGKYTVPLYAAPGAMP